ncbi:MAG: hypothetical protein P1U41_02495 [Vicingaceae bacterium]|nr:hypothetical protein [Vicingaceae bacterium]
MKAFTVLVLGVSLSFYSCKSQSQAMDSNNVEPVNIEKENTSANEDGVYDIIVSFASKGTGINRDVKQKLDDALTVFSQNNGVTLNLEKLGWGREGEIDYLFLTKNLSTKQKKELKAKVKEVIGDTEMIFISYDSKCVHKR